jgi:hypothetical protein
MIGKGYVTNMRRTEKLKLKEKGLLSGVSTNKSKGKGKVHCCTGTEDLYRPYGKVHRCGGTEALYRPYGKVHPCTGIEALYRPYGEVHPCTGTEALYRPQGEVTLYRH